MSDVTVGYIRFSEAYFTESPTKSVKQTATIILLQHQYTQHFVSSQKMERTTRSMWFLPVIGRIGSVVKGMKWKSGVGERI
jgi:hypothetical protein